jgi:hypothetical protein
VICISGGRILIEPVKVVWLPNESETRRENAKLPATNGVPEIVPPVETVSPPGRDPPAVNHEYGGVPPDAASACE